MPTKPTAPRVTLDVKADTIVRASRKDSGRCMVADTIRAQVPGASNILVDVGTIRWSDRQAGYRYTYLTPLKARAAIALFDQGVVVQPFTMRLTKAVQIQPMTTTRESAKRTKRPTTSGPQLPLVDEVGEVTVLGGKQIPLDALPGTSAAERERSAKARKRGLSGGRRQRVFGLRELTPDLIAEMTDPGYKPETL
jgi:hypothetical protein